MKSPDARLLPVLLLAVLLTGCEQRYAIRIWNVSAAELENVVVTYSGVTTSFGHIGPSLYAVKSFMRHTPAGTAEVSWTNAAGETRQAAVDLSLVPTSYADGVLSFKFHDDESVTASFFFKKKDL